MWSHTLLFGIESCYHNHLSRNNVASYGFSRDTGRTHHDRRSRWCHGGLPHAADGGLQERPARGQTVTYDSNTDVQGFVGEPRAWQIAARMSCYPASSVCPQGHRTPTPVCPSASITASAAHHPDIVTTCSIMNFQPCITHKGDLQPSATIPRTPPTAHTPERLCTVCANPSCMTCYSPADKLWQHSSHHS